MHCVTMCDSLALIVRVPTSLLLFLLMKLYLICANHCIPSQNTVFHVWPSSTLRLASDQAWLSDPVTLTLCSAILAKLSRAACNQSSISDGHVRNGCSCSWYHNRSAVLVEWWTHTAFVQCHFSQAQTVEPTLVLKQTSIAGWYVSTWLPFLTHILLCSC